MPDKTLLTPYGLIPTIDKVLMVNFSAAGDRLSKVINNPPTAIPKKVPTR